MSDLWQGLAENRLHPFHLLNQTYMANHPEGHPGTDFHHFHPLNQTYDTSGSTRSTEFEFWESRKMNELETLGDFQIPAQNGYGHGEHSPPLWKTNTAINPEVYPPLLPCNNLYSNLTPKSQIQAILKGRKELMEMIQNIPESSYELSLKDIVDHDVLQQSGEDRIKEDLDCRTGFPIQQKTKIIKNSKAAAAGQLHRSGSMDNNTFLLKMFFPASLTVKKSTKGKYAKVTSRSPSLERSECRENKGWKKRFSITGRRSFSSSNSDSIRSRHTDSNLFSGCWPFPHTRKTKILRQRGCFF